MRACISCARDAHHLLYKHEKRVCYANIRPVDAGVYAAPSLVRTRSAYFGQNAFIATAHVPFLVRVTSDTRSKCKNPINLCRQSTSAHFSSLQRHQVRRRQSAGRRVSIRLEMNTKFHLFGSGQVKRKHNHIYQFVCCTFSTSVQV